MNPNLKYRELKSAEIKSLISTGCSSENWEYIKVIDGFDPSRCRNISFSGDVKLGLFRKPFIDATGVTTPSGLLNARIHNCTIGSDVVINNIGEYIANYIIEDEAVIVNCGKIFTEGLTSFGNGTPVAVLNETGGRTVKLWDRLSAHEAYIIALYRHRSKAIHIIENMIGEYALSMTSETGIIGRDSRIFNCSFIRNVKIGPFTNVDGAIRLNEGSVNSCREDPVFIGPGVIMEHFIACSGSIVTESTLIDKCFIGQGCVLRKHYSAENSLFFANCGGYHGEACSIFAGPFTLTHRRNFFIHECRKRVKPEQPYVQAWTHTPGDHGKRVQNYKRFISSLACANWAVYTGNGTALQEYGYLFASILLSY
jgi:hypothetical protein